MAHRLPNNPLKSFVRRFKAYWHSSLWHRLKTIVVLVVVLWFACMYSIAQWYIWSEKNKPIVWGVSFIPDYAQSLGVDPQANMDALLTIGVKNFRLVSYWSDMEPSQGQYDFSQLDWEFKKAEKAGAHITLSLGLRQPRWPECHMPAWAAGKSESEWQPQLERYITNVVNRYKTSPSLASYQVENEFFLSGFGKCGSIPGWNDRNRLVAEYNLVKKTDPAHTAIIARSNNALGWPVGAPTPDEFGISVYKRVWDGRITHRYMEYPIPAWYYGFLAGWQKLVLHRDMIIHELQAEAWAPNYKSIQETSLAEQNKSLDATRLQGRFTYAKQTGMREIYLWGAEYWYYRKAVLHDDSLWQVAQTQFSTKQ